jgi:PAS domain S-box-containing protein
LQAAKLIEGLFGNAWALDAAGRWIYLSRFAQTSLDMTLDDLNSALDKEHTAWKRLLHPQEYNRVAALWRRSLRSGEHFDAEFRIRRATGVYVWTRSAARPMRDDQARITGWFGTSIDIDGYKKTESALRDRERELSQLVDMVPSHIWRMTPEGETTLVNMRVADFLGVDAADKSGLEQALAASIHPDDAPAAGDVLGRCLLTGERFSMKYRLRRADGAYRWMSGRAEPMRDENGRIVQWFGLCHDIDDQMHAEDALRRASDKLARATQAASLS